jgi:hypothetical protein
VEEVDGLAALFIRHLLDDRREASQHGELSANDAVERARWRALAERLDVERRNRQRAEALTALVAERLPAAYDATGDHDAWPLLGAALLSRATSTLRHVFDAGRGRQSIDAATLGRSLYEHVLHFAWLAADPSPARLQEWRKADLVQRLKADNDARTVGVQLFDDAARAQVQAQVELMTGNDLVLSNLAIAADKHWAGKLPAMGTHRDLHSFKGLYAVLYRQYSGTAHPSYIGLNHVVEDVTTIRKRVVVEKPPEGRGPSGWPRWCTGSACMSQRTRSAGPAPRASPPRLTATPASPSDSNGARPANRGAGPSVNARPRAAPRAAPRFSRTLREQLSLLASHSQLIRATRTMLSGDTYLIASYTLNIGMYIATTMNPTIPPTSTIMTGSRIDVSALIAAATSSS